VSEEPNEIEHPPPFGSVPAEFIDPEGDGELHDPALAFESTADMRRAWKDWLCAKGPGEFANVQFFGKGIGGVPAPAVEAFKALEAALIATGYQPRGSWSNKCRKIRNTDRYSLHSYGVAIDIDSKENPQSAGSSYSGKIQKPHIDAVLAIRNLAGRRVWQWGGTWSTPDRMHFQLDQGPKAVAVDPSTVPGAVHVVLEAVTHQVTATSLNMRTEPTTSGALISGLPQGAAVAAQADPMQESDDHQWIRVEAVVGGQLQAGWVANAYLEALDTAASPPTPEMAPAEPPVVVPQGELHIDGATHRVKATGLNLRSDPTTSGALLASLPDGAGVAAMPDTAQENDDYVWIKIKAAVEGGIEEGWVASKYLEAAQ
jgi:uncharacterized protein YraI